MSTIGIRVADGSLYPVLTSGDYHTKKLVLSTAKDNQVNVRIDLYKGEGQNLESARCIGTIVLDNISSAPKGDTEIDFLVSLDAQGVLSASATDPQSGESQSLSLTTVPIEEDEVFEMSDPGMDYSDGVEYYEPQTSTYDSEDDTFFIKTDSETPVETYEFKYKKLGVVDYILLAAFVSSGVVVTLLAANFIFNLIKGGNVPPLI